MAYDLLVQGGRVIDPANGIDEVRDIAVADGRIAAIDAAIPADRATRVIDADGCIVAPGLIDMHAHVYWGGTSLGVDANQLAARSATTTFVDAGSAGAGNFLGFRRHVIEPAKVRILAFANISFGGIFGFSRNVMVGECSDLRLCDPREAVACMREHGDIIVGLKVRSGRIAGGTSGIAPVDLAIEAADKARLPLMAHIDEPPPGRSEVLDRLRRGDILTHCFRPFPNSPVYGSGQIRADVRLARDRGVIFDIGHGMGSFDFQVAKAMLQDGFLPDVISSDVHLYCVDGPAFDLLVCMSKLLALDMPLIEVIRAATQRPAEAIGRTDLGTLGVGSPADISLLRLISERAAYVDSVGQQVVAEQRLVSRGIVAGGAWWANEESARLESYVHPAPASHTDVAAKHFGCAPRQRQAGA